MLLLAGGIGACVVVGATSAVARNWDLALQVLVVAVALVADLVRGLRPRDFVVAGPDGLVVRVRGRTASWPWAAVVRVEHVRGRFGRSRPVLRLVDGATARLPRQAPPEDLARWVGGRDHGGPAEGA